MTEPAQKPFVIAIAGPSCSGKTSISRGLAAKLGDVTLFGFDNYYHDLGHMPYEKRCEFNFDHPDSLEAPMLIEHVQRLAQGEEIERPVYDFAAHTRERDRFDRITPASFVIFEGLFTLHWPQVHDAYHTRIYVDAPDAVCFRRRLGRDVHERARTPESIRYQYDTTVRPGAEQFVRPSRIHADLVVNGEHPIAHSVEEILRFIEKRKQQVSSVEFQERAGR